MALEINVPDLGEGLTEAEIVQWLVEVGETVTANQPMVEVETAKAVVEISAPRPGVLAHHGAAAGATLEVGQLLAVITGEGETWAGGEDDAALLGDVQPASAATGAAPSAAPVSPTGAVTPPPGPTGPVKAVPLVRKLAKISASTSPVSPGPVPMGGSPGRMSRRRMPHPPGQTNLARRRGRSCRPHLLVPLRTR